MNWSGSPAAAILTMHAEGSWPEDRLGREAMFRCRKNIPSVHDAHGPGQTSIEWSNNDADKPTSSGTA